MRQLLTPCNMAFSTPPLGALDNATPEMSSYLTGRYRPTIGASRAMLLYGRSNKDMLTNLFSNTSH
jgi:hypothetical protein